MKLNAVILSLLLSYAGNGQLNIPCNNWLGLPSYQSYVSLGDLDISGNQITVEAIFTRTAPYINGSIWAGDLVSKHVDPNDINYLLRPNNAEITTTSGYFITPPVCEIELNKTYHAAMVYDGSTLKFYRNGFLMSSVPASGNMFQNNHEARIGLYNGLLHNTNLIGYINEVRLWNVVRTQAQIRAFMNNSLPNPATQTGLIAYYTFDNLLNKQGNPAWNGTLGGAASINSTTTNCNFFIDSCSSRVNIGNIINDYTPVLSLNPCDNKITVENAAAFNAGDTVLMIQMKGAVIDSTNTAAFGTISNYKNAGNYEFNYVKSKAGNIIELLNGLTRQYDIPLGKVQLVRVPYYSDVNITSTLTCLPWDGNKGGILVLNVQDSITMSANIDVTGKGFRGGVGFNSQNATLNCFQNNYHYPQSSNASAGQKGESIATHSQNINYGKGSPANGGGGGLGHNSGGGGGANGGAGGLGGYQLEPCGNSPFDNRGIGGHVLTTSTATNRIFLGGGGGAGQADNPGNLPPHGGNGGGIVLILSNYLQTNSNKILANGNNGTACTIPPSQDCHDAMGGGGAAGSILLSINQYLDNTLAENKGGKGADMIGSIPLGGRIGPGGGGSGGLLFIKNSTLPANLTNTNTGGANGVLVQDANNPWGATPGQNGATLFNLVVPVANILFKPNIDSVRIQSTPTSCSTFNFNGLGYTNTNPISIWQWYFGDAGTANTQNATHTYSTSGSYTVKLVVTDINGCKDSISRVIDVSCIAVGNIINDYTPVLALNPCNNKITVEDATAYNVGDTVLMIQMKGAIIDSANTAAFGTITDYRNAGNYEFNYVKSKTGNIIELLNVLTRQYDIPVGKVQLVRVPYYQNANITSTLTCLAWDGSKGGVLVLNAQDSIILNSNIDVTGKGFRGGADPFSNPSVFNCYENQFYYPVNPDLASGKGEGIAEVSAARSFGKGALANGGGGGNSHNSGGGGGSNAASGGFGGYNFEDNPCNATVPFDNRGIGGKALTYNNTVNKIFLGGGGGAGHSNNPEAFQSNGGNGSGIVILMADKLQSNSNKIFANGSNASACIGAGSGCHEGMGGGGAGGATLLKINNYIDPAVVEIKGGSGGNMVASGFLKVGPGGGGGGGKTWFVNPSQPAAVTVTVSGGAAGVCTAYSNNPWGATPGQLGSNSFNLVIPVDIIAFKPNIDSVRIKDSATGCSSFDFKGFGYTNTNPISTWQWYFGDGGTANTQNTAHTYGTAGNYIVKLVVTDINGCKDSISKNITAANSLSFDFTYQQNTCNPLSVQFTGIGASNQTPFWSFGDATTVSGITNPVHVYPALGNYIVKYSVGNGICTDTVTKTISLSIIDENIILTQDTTICAGSTKQLLTTTALGFCWSPTTWLNNPNSPNPITSTPQNITYYFTADVPGNNIITNGNFNNGNTGFTSQYNFANPNVTEGQYFVGPNSQAWNSSLSNCSDHTGGNGNMLLVNGSPTPNVKVWSQTVAVTPNTNYAFSTWIQAVSSPNPAQLSFSINNNDIGSLITASLPVCTWRQFYTSWNSGNNTTANISIVNKNTLAQGNDFALDDITFAPVVIKRDSVKITVETPAVTATNSTGVCSGGTVQLNASGASTYSWTPAQGLSNPNIANPVATPAVTTQYIVTGLTANGCIAKDTVDITLLAKPTITKSADTTICSGASTQLSVNGGVSYSWSPATTLNNATIPNPIATPLTNTTYQVIVTDANGCNNNDSIKVTLRSSNTFSISSPPPVCMSKSTQLNASGGHLYTWQPAGSLDNPNISNPTASPLATTIYSVQITDTVCHITSTLSTTLTVLPLPTITANKSNDVDCSVTQSQLIASGGTRYTWTPTNSLNNPNSGSPIASPSVTTQYIVTGTTSAGCVNYDSVTVNVTNLNEGGYLMPTGFTPNNDGLNDCYGIKYWGTILELEFSIYNRWGERIFYTTQPGKCWDGRLRGVPQDPDVFVYMIRAKTICEGSVFRKGTFVLIR